jgi:hypothetical protein
MPLIKNWDAFIRALDARFGVLEEQLGIEREVTEAILQRGLQVIEDQLAPTVAEAQIRADEITRAARELGLLFRASSASPVAIGEGSRSFVIGENERNRFAAPLFVIAATDGDPSQWMAGQVLGWDVETGTLTVAVAQTRGMGTHAAWQISIAGIPPRRRRHRRSRTSPASPRRLQPRRRSPRRPSPARPARRRRRPRITRCGSRPRPTSNPPSMR